MDIKHNFTAYNTLFWFLGMFFTMVNRLWICRLVTQKNSDPNTELRIYKGSIPHIIVPLTYTLNCKSNVVSKALWGLVKYMWTNQN